VTGAGQSGRPRTPQAKFSQIAPRYDLWNACLSLGLDHRWRKTAARALDLRPGARVLDIGTGTGALARAVADVTPNDVRISGCDCNAEMLRVAEQHLGGRYRDRIELHFAFAESLPFPESSFDAATIAFAIDDFVDREKGLAEIHRVLKPRRPLIVLELSLPTKPLLNGLYRLYLRAFPAIDRWIDAGGGYRHLREEIEGYRGREAVPQLFSSTGFRAMRSQPLTGGLVTLHVAHRRD
jgi:demethylmenaquinone methyltransferase/2-methoxy-6-polyprenyl-1,4-benzoquinol methylase